MDPDGQLRNLRDFLLVYNRMTEICFQRCTSNFNYRNLTMDEERCADSCAGKLIRTNHRLMGTYVQLMPAMVQKRMQEMESKAAEVAKAEAAAALENPSTAITDTSTVSPSTLGIPATSSPVVGMPLPTTPMLESPQIPSSLNNPSDIKTSSSTISSAFGEMQSEGLVAKSAVISTTSNVPNVGLGPVSSEEDKLNLKPSSVTSTSVLETQSAAGQTPQTPS
ncbi:Mitochondrial import inner membrane translocase subunit Tim10 B [Anabarilius grahami]|uniref:Mitochondrial import inner membrane translocase subunit Tim10 B n=1 Tax=Anabarilius grahami TaxID=495550 RepID=A0A3N0Z7T2_ANAGA|nr:Mitochondrial import inner membrane translocase subunit Tim10 B [Anabarilius grahami]